ncbi:MAG: DUF1592 domain-containing protein, partial [Planctomycetota bacterium]
MATATTQYCVHCHGEESEFVGDVDLSGRTVKSLVDDPELILKLIEVLDTQQMPPEDEPQPAPELRRRLLADLRALSLEAVADAPAVVRTPIRRMNRFQYDNAVSDLFQLNCTLFALPERAMRGHDEYFDPASGKMPDRVRVGNRALGKSQMIEPRLAGVAAFPQDLRAEHGYDNQGDHLSLSPLLMEAFLTLGRTITTSPDFGPQRVGIWESFFAAPDDGANLASEVRTRLQPFLSKAFRRPPDDELVDRYARFVTREIDAGSDFTDAMLAAAAATIASPRFLYLYEANAPRADVPGPQAIDDFELASRLSFFLWGSLPDDGLLAVAAAGRLSEPDVLNRQIDRLLRDKKLKRFCDSFPSQWLQLDRIVSSIPNRQLFPRFYFGKYRVSMHMMLEPLLLFETVLIENLPITQLIDPDFT